MQYKLIDGKVNAAPIVKVVTAETRIFECV